MVLIVIGTIRTVVLFVFLFGILTVTTQCFCLLCTSRYRQAVYKLFKAKATNRFLSFNCNCPCYRARPKLRFQLQFAFVILISCVRIAAIVFSLVLGNHVTTRSLAVIVAISFIFLLLTSLLDYYHYRVWWYYKPTFVRLDPSTKIPTAPLSTKHRRYLPEKLLGSQRTGQAGDKLCTNEPCTNRKLEHILIFHLSDHQPQPRWSEVKRLNLFADTYIGFHRTSADSALKIAHDAFHRSTTPPQMLGFGIYFARSIKHTERKARFRGAIIAAEIRMGNVKEVTQSELHTVRNTDLWHPEFDTVYYNHENDERDEFCVYDESQILQWIMVVDSEFDGKSDEYGMDQEFADTKCSCI